MEMMNDAQYEQIAGFIEASGEEGTTVKEVIETLFPEFDETILSAFTYLIDGKKAELDSVIMSGNDFKVIPMIAGGI